MHLFKLLMGILAGSVVSLGIANAELPEATDRMRSIANFYVPDIGEAKHYSEAELDGVFYGDTILISLSRGRYRVIHFGEDGLLNAWFPGRNYVGKADFGFVEDAAICIDSIARNSNGQGEVTCQTIEQLVGNILDRVEGDPFGLASLNAPPWNLPNTLEDMSFSGINAMAPNTNEEPSD